MNSFFDPNILPEEREKKRKYARVAFKQAGLAQKTYIRDNFICNKCGCKTSKDNKPIAHHMNGFCWDLTNRHNLYNLLLLCNRCHREFHSEFGLGKNTIEQNTEFLGHIPKHLEHESIHLEVLIKKFDPIYLGM